MIFKKAQLSLSFGLACATLSVLLTSQMANAQVWPVKPITMVVTYPAGGGADTMARLLAPKMSAALGQSIVIENKPGASGQIGASAVAKATPDGYTIMLDASSFAVNPALFPKLPYDSARAFAPIGVIAQFPNVILVNPQFAVKTVSELINLAKQKKDAVSYASSGNGSAQHLAGAMFESAAKVDMLHVPYKGGALALNDVMGGQVPLFFGNLASTLQHIQSGRLRALAVTSNARATSLPNIPTLAEAGLVGAEIYEWNALFAPAGTPEAVLEKLSNALQMAMQTPEVKERISQLGGVVSKTNPLLAKQFIAQQAQVWANVIKAKGIALE